ncbi:MAG: OmpA family protein, partial [Flavobacteriaceae bacterium]|nr:OmpA family protein [Flavobacteriaceae bacterium]
TTLLGNANRHLRDQYDKINELNDILMNKNTKMLNDMNAENRQLLTDLQTTRQELIEKEDALRALENELNAKEANLDSINNELISREQKVNELQDLLSRQQDAATTLKNKIADALLGFKDKGLTIEQKNGKVYVSLEAKLLFPSGSTVIDAEGKRALIDLANAIEGQSDMEIIVEGHTDTDALRSTSIPRDNWELSVLRATAVVKIMTENSKVSPLILSASGRSEYHPVDPEDKARNRRIEIIISPNLNELFEIIDNP